MKKKNLVYIITLSVLAMIAYWLHYRTSKSTIPQELRDFAVQDTATVTKIFMADKNNNKLLLERISFNEWKVNQKYIVRQDAINLLLSTMKQLAVKNPVPKTAYNNVVKEMAASAVKVEIYQNNNLTKTYYVGSDTHDYLGTYMLIEGSSTPFVMEIPGFNGFVSVRYFLSEDDWRDKSIFKLHSKNISTISVSYADSSLHSFTIQKPDSATLWITNNNEDTIKDLDTLKVLSYLNIFTNIQFEGFVRMDQNKTDSICNSVPFCILSITAKNDNKKTVKIYPKPIGKRSTSQVDESGTPLQYDVDRLYAIIDDSLEIVLIQYYVFDPILKNFDYFKNKRNKSI